MISLRYSEYRTPKYRIHLNTVGILIPDMCSIQMVESGPKVECSRYWMPFENERKSLAFEWPKYKGAMKQGQGMCITFQSYKLIVIVIVIVIVNLL